MAKEKHYMQEGKKREELHEKEDALLAQALHASLNTQPQPRDIELPTVDEFTEAMFIIETAGYDVNTEIGIVSIAGTVLHITDILQSL